MGCLFCLHYFFFCHIIYLEWLKYSLKFDRLLLSMKTCMHNNVSFIKTDTLYLVVTYIKCIRFDETDFKNVSQIIGNLSNWYNMVFFLFQLWKFTEAKSGLKLIMPFVGYWTHCLCTLNSLARNSSVDFFWLGDHYILLHELPCGCAGWSEPQPITLVKERVTEVTGKQALNFI